MTKSEAIILLAACAPLADKLALQGVHLDLSQNERAVLQGFKQIGCEASRWLGDPEVYTKAGLNTSLLALLDFKARLELTKETKRKTIKR